MISLEPSPITVGVVRPSLGKQHVKSGNDELC